MVSMKTNLPGYEFDLQIYTALTCAGMASMKGALIVDFFCVCHKNQLQWDVVVFPGTRQGNVLTDKPKKTCWHCLLARALKELLGPLDIQVLTEVPVVPDPPKADIILLRREGVTWTKEQSDCLADGLRDTDAEVLLVEFKYTESMTDDAFGKLFVYDFLYRESEGLKRSQLQSFLVSAKTPGTDILARYGFEPTGRNGVYTSEMPIVGTMQVILLNELDDQPHNAVLKCFSSRQKEKVKAFGTMHRHVLPSRTSGKLAWVTFGLSRIMMEKTLYDPEVMGWTPDDIVKLGKEWIETKVLESNQRESEARMLSRQIQHRFGGIPSWTSDKIAKADLPTLERWSLRILDAKTLEDIFGD